MKAQRNERFMGGFNHVSKMIDEIYKELTQVVICATHAKCATHARCSTHVRCPTHARWALASARLPGPPLACRQPTTSGLIAPPTPAYFGLPPEMFPPSVPFTLRTTSTVCRRLRVSLSAAQPISRSKILASHTCTESSTPPPPMQSILRPCNQYWASHTCTESRVRPHRPRLPPVFSLEECPRRSARGAPPHSYCNQYTVAMTACISSQRMRRTAKSS